MTVEETIRTKRLARGNGSLGAHPEFCYPKPHILSVSYGVFNEIFDWHSSHYVFSVTSPLSNPNKPTPPLSLFLSHMGQSNRKELGLQSYKDFFLCRKPLMGLCSSALKFFSCFTFRLHESIVYNLLCFKSLQCEQYLKESLCGCLPQFQYHISEHAPHVVWN